MINEARSVVAGEWQRSSRDVRFEGGIGGHVLILISDLLETADIDFRNVVTDLIYGYDVPSGMSAEMIAARCGVSKRTALYRAKDAGFVSLKRILIAVQFLPVCPMLFDRRVSYKMIMAKCGYRTRSHLRRHCFQLTGYRPSELRSRTVSLDEVACLIADYLREQERAQLTMV